jgi:hypothetical protein
MQTAPVQLAETWKDFFVIAAGASATLVGLVIVAISVNLQRILEQPQLPSRGGAGPYWIAWGMITTFVLSVINTWILLVEILR